MIEVLAKGMDLRLLGEVPNCLAAKFRQLMEAQGSYGGDKMKFVLSVLMKTAFIRLKLKSPLMIENFFSKLGLKDFLSQVPNLEDILSMGFG